MKNNDVENLFACLIIFTCGLLGGLTLSEYMREMAAIESAYGKELAEKVYYGEIAKDSSK